MEGSFRTPTALASQRTSPKWLGIYSKQVAIFQIQNPADLGKIYNIK
jgi:hypothetical protein